MEGRLMLMQPILVSRMVLGMAFVLLVGALGACGGQTQPAEVVRYATVVVTATPGAPVDTPTPVVIEKVVEVEKVVEKVVEVVKEVEVPVEVIKEVVVVKEVTVTPPTPAPSAPTPMPAAPTPEPAQSAEPGGSRGATRRAASHLSYQ